MRAYIIEGKVPLLISKPFLQALGANINLAENRVELDKLGVTLEMTGQGEGHIMMNLMEFGPQGFQVPRNIEPRVDHRECRIYHAEGEEQVAEVDIPQQDTWEQQGDHWIRHHYVARRSLYSPDSSGKGDGPDSKTLDNTGITEVEYLGAPDTEGRGDIIKDIWSQPKTRKRRCLDFAWRGRTIFKIAGPSKESDEMQEEGHPPGQENAIARFTTEGVLRSEERKRLLGAVRDGNVGMRRRRSRNHQFRTLFSRILVRFVLFPGSSRSSDCLTTAPACGLITEPAVTLPRRGMTPCGDY